MYKICAVIYLASLIGGALGGKGRVPAPAKKRYDPWQRRQETTEFVTFNTGLAEADVPEYDTRRQALLSKLSNNEFPGDVICLQEVWKPEDISDIVQAANGDYPHSFSAIHKSDGVLSPTPTTPACDLAKIGPALGCIQTQCIITQVANIGVCIATKCRSEIIKVPQECLSCIIYGLSARAGNSGEVLMMRVQTCASIPWRNTFGLLVLSKRPLTYPKVVNYHPDISVLLARGYIQAKVGVYQVFCTHMLAAFDDESQRDVAPFDTNKERVLFETASLLNAASPFLSDSILLGDFNAGRDIPEQNITNYAPNSYRLLTQNYFSPHVESVGTCTYCGTNPLADSSVVSYAIDHVFLPNPPARQRPGLSMNYVKKASTVLDKILPGENIPLSDHFGVSVVIQRRFCRWWFWHC